MVCARAPAICTPDVAIITYAAIAFALSFSSTFQKLAVLSNMAVLLLYILCCLAALELNRRDIRSDGAPFKFRGATLVPILAIVVIIWVLAHAKRDEFAITAACLAVATVLFPHPQIHDGDVRKGLRFATLEAPISCIPDGSRHFKLYVFRL